MFFMISNVSPIVYEYDVISTELQGDETDVQFRSLEREDCVRGVHFLLETCNLPISSGEVVRRLALLNSFLNDVKKGNIYVTSIELSL